MEGNFDIAVDDKTSPDYDVADNIAENLVDVVRSELVGNEKQFLATNAVFASSLSPDPNSYIQLIIRGKSGDGKTKLKQTVDSMYPSSWLLQTGSTSDQGLVDSDEWNEVKMLSAAEYQQIQGKMLEMIKSSAGEDSSEDGVGFKHTRNVDSGGERDSKDIEKQSMPTVFLFADENNSSIPKELRTRQMTVRVESDEELNRGVAKTMFDHQEVEVANREYEYNFNFDEGKKAVKNHIANIPQPISKTMAGVEQSYSKPVIIPYDEGVMWPTNSHPEYESRGWDAFKVLDSIFNYNKTESKRGAKAIANHIRSWARLNYHSRETMTIGGTEYVVAEPQDVANVLSYRDLLLNVTHNINEQKLAVIEALTDEDNGVGARGPNDGMWAPHKDIRHYIDEYADITSLSKNQLTNSQNSGVLDQMEQDYLIEVHKGEGPNGAHMYEFIGGQTFGHPNLDVYSDLFEYCTDPVTGDSIHATIESFKEELSVESVSELLDADETDLAEPDTTDVPENDDTSGLGAFTDDDDDSGVEWNELHETLHKRLSDAVDDKRVTASDKSSMHLEHLLGISPIEYYDDDRGMQYVRKADPRTEEHKRGTIMHHSHSYWGDKSQGQVESAVENAFKKLLAHGKFIADEEPDADDYYLYVQPLSE